MQIVATIRLNVDEETIRKRFTPENMDMDAESDEYRFLQIALEGFKEHDPADGVMFHREMDIPFLPVKDMIFEFTLTDPERTTMSDSGFFLVKEVKWVEADGKIHVFFEQDPDSDILLPSDFAQKEWKVGPYGYG